MYVFLTFDSISQCPPEKWCHFIFLVEEFNARFHLTLGSMAWTLFFVCLIEIFIEVVANSYAVGRGNRAIPCTLYPLSPVGNILAKVCYNITTRMLMLIQSSDPSWLTCTHSCVPVLLYWVLFRFTTNMGLWVHHHSQDTEQFQHPKDSSFYDHATSRCPPSLHLPIPSCWQLIDLPFINIVILLWPSRA